MLWSRPFWLAGVQLSGWGSGPGGLGHSREMTGHCNGKWPGRHILQKARMLGANPRGPRPRTPGKAGFFLSTSPAQSRCPWSTERPHLSTVGESGLPPLPFSRSGRECCGNPSLAPWCFPNQVHTPPHGHQATKHCEVWPCPAAATLHLHLSSSRPGLSGIPRWAQTLICHFPDTLFPSVWDVFLRASPHL